MELDSYDVVLRFHVSVIFQGLVMYAMETTCVCYRKYICYNFVVELCVHLNRTNRKHTGFPEEHPTLPVIRFVSLQMWDRRSFTVLARLLKFISVMSDHEILKQLIDLSHSHQRQVEKHYLGWLFVGKWSSTHLVRQGFISMANVLEQRDLVHTFHQLGIFSNVLEETHSRRQSSGVMSLARAVHQVFWVFLFVLVPHAPNLRLAGACSLF